MNHENKITGWGPAGGSALTKHHPPQISESDIAIYAMAHDIKSPINQVSGLLEIASKLNQDDEVAGVLAMAIQANASLNRKVHELLEMNEPAAAHCLVNPQELIRQTWTELSSSGNTDHITFFLRDNVKKEIRTDRVRLQSILRNLLENAVKYGRTKARDNSILVSIQRVRDRLAVKVMDNGPGIPPRALAMIFERRFQSDPMSDGHGMGLYLSRQNARDMGGDLTAASVPGRGTTFTLRIPCFSM